MTKYLPHYVFNTVEFASVVQKAGWVPVKLSEIVSTFTGIDDLS